MPKNISKTLKQALIIFGLTAVGLTLFAFVPEVLAQGSSPLVGEALPGKLGEATGGQGSLRGLVLTFLNFFLGFLGLLAVIMIIYGGVLYVTAAGNPENVDKAKKIIMYAIIGIVVILLSFALVNTVLGGLAAGTDT